MGEGHVGRREGATGDEEHGEGGRVRPKYHAATASANAMRGQVYAGEALWPDKSTRAQNTQKYSRQP